MLIDTAGRYTTQDTDAKAERASWLAFLDLLKTNRPRQPINGVMVAISVEDLLTSTPEQIAAHADAIRNRLLELNERLKVDFPVYAVFTKTDLIAGFNEFFGELDRAAAPHGLGPHLPDRRQDPQHDRRRRRRNTTR